jgi:hypothetical protein
MLHQPNYELALLYKDNSLLGSILLLLMLRYIWLKHKDTRCQGCQMFFFKPQTLVWVNFGGPCNRISWNIL